MNKSTLIKFISNRASESEVDAILRWVKKSDENLKYLSELKRVYTYIDMAQTSSKGDLPDFKNTAKRRSRKIYLVASVAAACLIFFVAGLFINTPFGDRKQLASDNNISEKVTIHRLYTEKGVKGFVILPDSTKVWLNSCTELTYPVKFSGDSREISMSGEAYFEVAKDSLHPMIISTANNVSIEVLGTSFNLKSYKEDGRVETTLYTGSVRMHYEADGEKKTVLMQPDEKIVYELPTTKKSVAAFPQKIEKPQLQSAWKEGRLIFDQTPVKEVLKMIERWHGTSFIVKNDKIYDYILSADFESESLVQIMEIIKIIIPIDYKIENNVVTLM
ncbi:MAG: DUF4974 domain-containing protein [Bacteroidales bacterium]|nr:DUF4974 domain-containing protein [Bacteroidales bacterium]